MHERKYMRIEKDFLGEVSIPADALYGIHSYRARQNFANPVPFPIEWYKATGLVKLACLQDGEETSESHAKGTSRSCGSSETTHGKSLGGHGIGCLGSLCRISF